VRRTSTDEPLLERDLGRYDMGAANDLEVESYNPWSVVNLVFTHLTEQGLHPILGESGDPGPPARALLAALGIEPAPEGNREVMRGVRAHLAEIREAVFEDD
jgi:hypothetical protein